MWKVGGEGVAALQVGQLLTNLRVSSSNMLLPFTAQIMQLLQDDSQPAGERRQLFSFMRMQLLLFCSLASDSPTCGLHRRHLSAYVCCYHDISHLMPAAVHCRHADN